VSLFQNVEENRFIRECEIGQYSCFNLLRDMEAVMSESDKEDVVMAERDEDVVFLPECLLERFVEARRDTGLLIICMISQMVLSRVEEWKLSKMGRNWTRLRREVIRSGVLFWWNQGQVDKLKMGGLFLRKLRTGRNLQT
jgi:hypothetical protein